MGTNPTLPPQFVLDALEDCILKRSELSGWSWCGRVESSLLEEDDEGETGADELVEELPDDTVTKTTPPPAHLV
jgi:hypothetical protein